MGMPERPSPPVTLVERLRRWVEWVGAGRVVATAAMVLAVVAAGYWLVRPPAAATEARLPLAPGVDSLASSPISAASADVVAVPSRRNGTVVVHVAGAVMVPGVHELPEGSRVVEALAAAGGPTLDANPDALNLAAVVVDGQRIYVPRAGEPVSAGGVPPDVPTGPLDINAAGAAAFESLPGIGPALAAAIVTYRTDHGPFRSVDALAQVPGIGPAKVEVLRELVTV